MSGSQQYPVDLTQDEDMMRGDHPSQRIPRPRMDNNSLMTRFALAKANSKPLPPAPRAPNPQPKLAGGPQLAPNQPQPTVAGYFEYVTDIGQIYGEGIQQRFLRLSQVYETGDIDDTVYLQQAVVLLGGNLQFLMRLSQFLPPELGLQPGDVNGAAGVLVPHPVGSARTPQFYGPQAGLGGSATTHQSYGPQVGNPPPQLPYEMQGPAPIMGTWGQITAPLPVQPYDNGYNIAREAANLLAAQPFASQGYQVQAQLPRDEADARTAPANGDAAATLAELRKKIRSIVPHIARNGWLRPLINRSRATGTTVDARRQLLRDAITRLADPAERIAATSKSKKPAARRALKQEQRNAAAARNQGRGDGQEWTEQDARENGMTCSTMWCANVLLPAEEEIGICEYCIEALQEDDEDDEDEGSDVEMED